MTFILDMIAMATAFPRAVLPAMGVLILGTSYTQGLSGGGDDPAELVTGLLMAGIAGGAFIAGLFSGTFTLFTAQGKTVCMSVRFLSAFFAQFGIFVMIGLC